MQYYVKKGKGYVPVNDPYAYDGLGEGDWLVTVKPGSQSMRTMLNPDLANLEAAIHHLEDGLVRAIAKASELKPRSTPLTPKEQKAWKAFDKIMGNEKVRYFAQFSSYYDIASAGCQHIHKIMVENNCDVEKIKKKYPIKKRNENSILDLET